MLNFGERVICMHLISPCCVTREGIKFDIILMGLKIPTWCNHCILQSIHILSPNMARLKKNSSILENWKLLKHNNRRTRIPRWLGRENEENVARTRNWCGGPSSPRVTKQKIPRYWKYDIVCRKRVLEELSVFSRNNMGIQKLVSSKYPIIICIFSYIHTFFFWHCIF